MTFPIAQLTTWLDLGMTTFAGIRLAEEVERASPEVVAVSRDDEQGHVIAPKRHERGQLQYAAEGIMRVRTPEGMWIIPPLRALWIPPGVEHDVTMLSRVSMRTIYIVAERAKEFGAECRLIEVTKLLRELILALIREEIEYPPDGRGNHIAKLILSEIASAESVPIQIPWPRDRRLRAMCEAIVKNPGQLQSLDDWADTIGASSRTIIRLFQRETGLQFRQWVQQVHVAEALCGLTRGVAVNEIARQLGYASPSAFTIMFRRTLGASPSQYLRGRSEL